MPAFFRPGGLAAHGEFPPRSHCLLTLLEFVPNADALGNTETAMRECYGYVFSVLTGR